jgi:uncharacterized protein (TIGR02246 family)
MTAPEAAAPGPSDPGPAVAAIRALNEAYCDAVNRRDGAAWAALWAEDARWDLMGHQVAGRDAIRATWEGAMAGFSFVGFFCQIGPVKVEGTTARATVWTHEVLVRQDGGESRPLGRYDDDYVLGQEGWRYAARRFSLRRE